MSAARAATTRWVPPLQAAAFPAVAGSASTGSCRRFASQARASKTKSTKEKGGKSSEASDAELPPAEGGSEGLPAGKDLKSTLAHHVESFRRELTRIRGATASPSMLDNVTVECYGERQPLKEVAQVALKTPLMLLVSPFDSALVDAVSDAIRDADLGLNPSIDGNSVRVPVPKTSKETREANVKLIGKMAEVAKTRVRRTRGDALDAAKKQEGVSEDDIRRESKEVEEATAAATAEVAKLAEKKKLEVESG